MHGAQAHAVGQPWAHTWPQEGHWPVRTPGPAGATRQDLDFLSGNMVLAARPRVTEPSHIGSEGDPADHPSHPLPFQIRKLRTVERARYLGSCTQTSSWGTSGLFLEVLEAAR